MTQASARQRPAMHAAALRSPVPRLGEVDAVTLAELLRRLREIDHSYRAAAENMGQLYMFADAHHLAALTCRLDQPMRNASQNGRDFAALLDELQMLAPGPTRRP